MDNFTLPSLTRPLPRVRLEWMRRSAAQCSVSIETDVYHGKLRRVHPSWRTGIRGQRS